MTNDENLLETNLGQTAFLVNRLIKMLNDFFLLRKMLQYKSEVSVHRSGSGPLNPSHI